MKDTTVMPSAMNGSGALAGKISGRTADPAAAAAAAADASAWVGMSAPSLVDIAAIAPRGMGATNPDARCEHTRQKKAAGVALAKQ